MPDNRQDHLALLRTFHYVLAGLSVLFAFLPVMHITIGIMMVSGKFDCRNPPPPFFGWMFIVLGALMILAFLTYAVLIFFSGRAINQRRHWLYVMILAGLSCACFPFGTVLGVFTIVILSKDDVKVLFGRGSVST